MSQKEYEVVQKASQFMQANKLDKAQSICKKILKKNPVSYNALHLLGVTYSLQEKPFRALEFYHRAHKINARDPILYVNLSGASWKTHDFYKALKYAAKGIELNPGVVELHEMYGKVSAKIFDTNNAVASLLKAIKLKEKDINLWTMLAETYLDASRYFDARRVLDKAFALDGSFVTAWKLRVRLYEEENDFTEALATIQAMRDKGLHSDWADRKWLDLLNDNGKQKESLEAAAIMIAVDEHSVPGNAYLISNGANEGGAAAGEASLIKLFGASQLSCEAYFSIANAYDREMNYEAAMKYYSLGHRTKKKSTKYSPLDTKIEYAALRRFIRTKAMDLDVDEDPELPTPIFVLGMPRSGTSLTEQILGCHSEIVPTGERTILINLLCYGNFGINYALQRCNADSGHLARVRATYLQYFKSLTGGAKFFVDKVPHNFELIGFIKLLFPEAKVIHCNRDALSTCLSIFKTNFTGHHPYQHSMKDLGAYYNEYLSLMNFWRELAPDFIHDLHYEELVANMPGRMKEVLEFCGLEWEEGMLDFYRSGRAVKTASRDQVRQPIYQSSIKPWEKYEEFIQPLIDAVSLEPLQPQ